MEVSIDDARGTDGGKTEGHHVMRTPRQLLAVLSVALAAIGVQTMFYPPQFLAFLNVWSATTIAAGISCAAAAIRPRRIWVAISGALVVTASCARGLALLAEYVNDGPEGPGAPLLVASITWAIVGLLAFEVWHEYVLPWSLAAEASRKKRSAP